MPKKLVLQEKELSELISLYKNGNSIRVISKELNHSRKTLSRILVENGVPIRNTSETSRMYSHDFDYFKNIDSEKKAYWLGFFYADGFVESKRPHGAQKFGITLSSKDSDHLAKFKSDIKSTNPILEYKGSGYNKDGYFSRILMTSQTTVNDLKRHGVVEQKTFKLDFPVIEKSLVRHFIRGYFDGDGYISVSKKSFVFGFSGREEFLLKIKEFFETSKANVLSDKSIYSFKIGGTLAAANQLDKIYKDATVFLDRKFEKYKIVYNKYSES